jgi:predicted nucleic acid-binding protein
MRCVLDSNVAVKWVLPEPETPKAVRLLNEFRAGLHELLAPDIFGVEVAHALAKAERRGIIRPPIGAKRLLAVMRNRPDLRPYLPLLPRAYAIASAARHGVYDCLYVALAEREGCELVTADRKLTSNLRARYPFIRDLATL